MDINVYYLYVTLLKQGGWAKVCKKYSSGKIDIVVSLTNKPIDSTGIPFTLIPAKGKNG